MIATQSLAVYVHFPWCVAKCPYCDFNSHALKGDLPEAAYLQALLADLHAQAPLAQGRMLSSVFFGGGTPSLFAPQTLEHLLSALREQWDCPDALEVTLEANPATVERGRFAEYQAAGITRVSLGAQSFDAARLKALGRIHVPEDVFRAAEELHAAGLANFNLDLMYALPHQTLAGAHADLATALSLQPAHVSQYQLTLEPGTVFAAQPPPLPGDELAWQMQQQSQSVLRAAGFAQYEVSAYAAAGRRCQHNLNYWQFGDYLGLGAGAHGKLTVDQSVRRSQHLREPRRYLSAAAQGPTWTVISPEQLPFEFMLNALRLNEGFLPNQFEGRTGLSMERVTTELTRLRGAGLVEMTEGHWRTTERGRNFLNDVLEAFLQPGQNSSVRTGS